MSNPEKEDKKAMIAAAKEALNLKLPPIVYPSEEATSSTSAQSKILKFRRIQDQAQRANQLVTTGAGKKQERALKEKKKKDPATPEPEYPTTMYSELRKKGVNYLFMKKCVESNPIVPIQKEWLDNMLKLVPLSLKTGKERGALVETLLKEVTNEFEKSMKRYMVRSVLVRPPVSWLEDEGGPLPESPLGLDFSKPWHSNFVQAKNQIAEALHVLHPILRMLLDLGHSTFADKLLVDMTKFR